MDGIAMANGLSAVLRLGARILLIAGLLAPGARAATVDLADYLLPGSGDDARPAFEQALAALTAPGNDRLHIPTGVYRLSAPADASFHLILDGLSGKRIDGYGATLMFTEAKGGLLLENLSDVSIEGLAFNWDPAPHVQGTIRARTDQFVILKPDPGFANVSADFFLHADRIWATPHEASGARLIRSGTGVIGIDSVGPGLDPSTLRLRLGDGVNPRLVQPGKKLVVVGRYEAAHAMTLENTQKLSLKDLRVFASPSMAVLATAGNVDLSVRGMHVIPDPSRQAFVSTNADGVHVVEPEGSTDIEQNEFQGLQDDAIVVVLRGFKGRIDDAGRTLLLGRGATRFQSGARVEAAVPEQGLRLLGVAITSLSNGAGRSVQLDPPAEGDTNPPVGRFSVFSVGSPARVTVAGNDIRNVRARGIRINYPNVQVIGNRIADTTGPALLAAPIIPSDDSMEPQYPAQGLVVRGTEFVLQQDAHSDADPSSGLVEIAPLLQKTRGNFGYLIQQVELSGNRFSFSADIRPDLCAISLVDVSGARIVGNHASVSGKLPSNSKRACGIFAQHVSDYEFSGNTLGTESVVQ